MNIRRFALAALLVAAGPVLAQTWTYGSFAQTNDAQKDKFGNTYTATSGTTKVTVNAFGLGSGTTFSTAYVGSYGVGSGFGVKNQTEGLSVSTPQHSMDNSVGIDMLQLRFTDTGTNADFSVVMTQLATGWHNTNNGTTAQNNSCGTGSNQLCGTDSDISLLRWTKTAAPTVAGKSIATLLSDGWELVNSYSDMVDGTNRATGLTTQSAGSSWWLISAYSSAWGACKGTNCAASLDDGNDLVKVMSSITAVPTTVTPNNGVPEPASLALVGAALLGAAGARRRIRRA